MLAANAKPSLSNRAASAWGYVAFLSGDPQGLTQSEASAKAMQSEALASLSDLRWSWNALSTFTIAATLAERFDDAEIVLDELISATENIGDTAGPIAGLALTRAIVAARQGRLAEALGFAERASSPRQSTVGTPVPDGCHSCRGPPPDGRGAEAVEWCDRIEPDAASRGNRPPCFGSLERPRSAPAARREIPGSQRTLREGRGIERSTGIGEPCWMPRARHAITAHLSADRTPDVHRVVAWLDRCAAQLPCRYPRIAAAAGRAALAEAEGNHESAESYLTSALALHESVGLPLEQVQTLLAYGAFRGGVDGLVGPARCLPRQRRLQKPTRPVGFWNKSARSLRRPAADGAAPPKRAG